MPTETLTYRFVEDGLSSLRRAFSRVESGLGGIEDAAGESGEAMSTFADDAETAAERVEARLSDTQGALDQIDTQRAQQALQQLDEGAAEVSIEPIASEAQTAGSRVQSEIGQAGSVIEDLRGQAQRSAAELEALGDVDLNLSRAESQISDVGEKSEESADQFQNAFSAAAGRVRDQIGDISSELEDFNEQPVELGGGADLTAQLGDIGGSALAEGLGTGAAIGGVELLNQKRFGEVNEEIREIGTRMDIVNKEFENLVDEAIDLKKQLSDTESTLSSGFGSEETRRRLDNIKEQLSAATEEGRKISKAIESEEFSRAADMAAELDNELEQTASSASEFGSEIQGVTDYLDELTGGLLSQASNAFSGLAGVVSRGGSKLTAFLGTAGGVTAAIGVLGAAAGVATKQIADFAAQVAEAGQQLKVMEAQSGVASTEAQELFKVAQQLDSTVDLDSIRDAFKELSLRTQEAREGTGEASEAFERLGINLDELEGKGTAEIFQRVRQEAQKLSAQQRALTLEQIAGGEAGERLARVFGLQADEYERLAGSVSSLSSEQVSTLDRLRTQYTQYTQKLKVAKQELAAAIGPPAVTLLNKFASAIEPVTSAVADLAREWRLTAAAALNYFGVLDDQETADFLGAGRNPDTSGGEGTTNNISDGESRRGRFSNRLREALLNQSRSIAKIKERAQRDLTSQEEAQRQIVSARETAFKQLQQLGQQFPSMFNEALLDRMEKMLKEARARLDAITSEEPPELPDGPARALGPEQADTSIGGTPLADGGLSLDQLKDLLPGAKDSVGEINSLISAVRDNFNTATNEEARGFVAKLQQMRSEMKQAQKEAEMIGQALERSVARSADRLFQSIGDSISTAIFEGGNGPGEAESRLQLFNAKKQIRSLRQSLRAGQTSYREFSLRVKTQQKKIQKAQKQLNEAMDSGFVDALESMRDAGKRILKQLVAEITAVIAKMAVLKALTDVFDITSGGFLGGVISNLGGGGFLDSGASGGTVKSDGLAKIHEGEEIVPSKVVSQLKGLTSQPAVMPGSGMNVNVNVAGRFRMEGRDMVAQVDNTRSNQSRRGR